MLDVQYTPEGIERIAQAMAVADKTRPAGTPWESVKEHYITMTVRALQEMGKIHTELVTGTTYVPLTLEESNDYTVTPPYNLNSPPERIDNEVLQTLSAMGVPIPLRVWASTMGLTLEALSAFSATPPKFKVGDNVRKSKGYKFPGSVRSVYTTLEGETRYVVQLVCDGVGGLQHIFNEEQLERAD